jgi:hypothetical protein
MNTTTDMNQHGGSSNWLVFLFGAVYNLLLTMNHDEIADFTLRSIIGAAVLLCFKLLGDWISRGGLRDLTRKRKDLDRGPSQRPSLKDWMKRRKQ